LILERDFVDLSTAAQTKLGLLSGEKVSKDLTAALLSKGLVQVVVDAISEKAAATQDALVTAVSLGAACRVLITSRLAVPELRSRSIRCEALPLAPDTLLFFIGRLVSVAKGKTGESLDDQQQLLIATRISEIIRVGSQILPLTPLLVELIVEKALRTQADDPQFEGIPATVPEAYVEYIRAVGQKDGDPMSSDRILRAAIVIAKLCLGQNFLPSRVRSDSIIDALKAEGFSPPEDSVNPLVEAGVLLETAAAPNTFVSFVLDPLAEYLGAYAWREDIGKNPSLLPALQQVFASEEFRGEGFRIAFTLVMNLAHTKG
jgi:hypothetical protein